MKSTCIRLALSLCFAFCSSGQGQEYFDGWGYHERSQNQPARAQFAFGTQQQSQPTEYQQIQYQQSQPSQLQPSNNAQTPGSQVLQHSQALPVWELPKSEWMNQEQCAKHCFDCARRECSTNNGMAGLYAGYSFAFTKLYMKESFEAYVLDFTNNTQTLVPFDYDYKLTPRVWIGARNERGIGARASYWNYDQSSNGFQFTNSNGAQIPVAVATSVIFPAAIAGALPGDTLTVSSAVEVSTLDLEGTYASTFGALETELAGGLRYARSEQTSVASVDRGVALPPFPPQTSVLNWQREFDGIGPVFSANGMLPIGNRGFYGVGAVGLSFLFGEKTIQRAVQNDSTPFPNTGLPFLNFEKADEISGIYNVRIGFGHRRPTAIGLASLEGTYEGQLWTDLGAPTLTFAGFNSFNLNLGLQF